MGDCSKLIHIFCAHNRFVFTFTIYNLQFWSFSVLFNPFCILFQEYRRIQCEKGNEAVSNGRFVDAIRIEAVRSTASFHSCQCFCFVASIELWSFTIDRLASETLGKGVVKQFTIEDRKKAGCWESGFPLISIEEKTNWSEVAINNIYKNMFICFF